jgi:hypothetical protein
VVSKVQSSASVGSDVAVETVLMIRLGLFRVGPVAAAVKKKRNLIVRNN